MLKKSKKGFTVIELLLVIAIIGLIASVLIVTLSEARAQARDAKRKIEVDTIRKAIEFYYIEYNRYPKKTKWASLEEDPILDTGERFSEAVGEWLPTIPKDPLWGQTKETGEPYSYQYKTNPDATEYKIHVKMETGAHVAYEAYSLGGGEIVYVGVGEVGPPTGYALDFDGIDDYVRVEDSPSLDITGPITVEAWIKADFVVTTPGWRALVYKLSTVSPKGGYGFLTTGDQSTVYFFVTSGGVCFIGTTIPIGEWQHFVGTYKENIGAEPDIKLYVDGAEIGSYDCDGYSPWANDKPLYIGGNPDDDGYARYEFKGIIDEVRIYNRALSATEIQEHYNGTFTDESGLVGLWHFDEGSGDTAADNSGNGNDGTLFNNPQWVSVP